MSSFLYSSAAKVVPECLSPAPPPSHVLITQINMKKAMDSPTSPDLLLSDDLIKPMILAFDQKIGLNPSLISPPAADLHPPDAAISSSCSPCQAAPASPEGQLWPKYTELDDRPSTPSVEQMIGEPASLLERPPSPSNEESEKTQAIRDPAYLFPKQTELNDCPPSPSIFKSEKMQVIREPPAYQTELGVNRPPSPPYPNAIKPRMQVMREADHKLPSQALDEPKMQTISEAAHQTSVLDDKLSAGMRESYRNSARGRLSRVVEESESFSRREFGANMLLYMSTHNSANHAANFSTHSSYNYSNFSSKLPSYHHNSRPSFSYNHSSHPPANFTNSKSAPAGSAVRTRSAFALFRRGSSEGGKLGGRVVYRRPKPRKQSSLGHRLLWPLLKIRNGYVGCMMGLEGTGDLSGMAQGGTYAMRAQYFADLPLSKTDSRNYG